MEIDINHKIRQCWCDMKYHCCNPNTLHYISRKDNDGNYCPKNCQWMTKSENISKSHKQTGRNANINAARIVDGTHNFLNSNIQAMTNAKRVVDGTHNFVGIIWVTDGVNNQMVLPKSIPDGYWKGRTCNWIRRD